MVFATPGMLHAGLSLQIFKKWAEDEKNMVGLITPSGCSVADKGGREGWMERRRWREGGRESGRKGGKEGEGGRVGGGEGI